MGTRLWIIVSGMIVASSFSCISAQGTTDVAQVVNDASKEHRVVRQIPRNFHIAQKLIYFWKYGHSWRFDPLKGEWKQWAKTGAAGLLLQSDDRQCELLYSAFLGGINHRSWIKNDLLNISQGRDSIRFEDHVQAFGGRKVKRRFGADSMFLLELPIEPMEQDSAIYTHCLRMYLTKGERLIDFIWFFTDQGYERREEYLRVLDGAVRYKRGRWKKPEWIRRQKEK